MLIKRQVLSNTNVILIAFFAVTGLLLVITSLVTYFSPQELPDLVGLYYSIMFLGGLIYTSNMFSELHDPEKSYRFLTLPVSNLERLVSSWVLSAIIFPFVALFAMILVVLLSNLIINFSVDPASFSGILSHTTFLITGIYIVTQSVFFLGAVYFRNHNFMKTLLSLFLISFVISIYTSLAGVIIFRPWEFASNMHNGNLDSHMEIFFEQKFPDIMNILFWYIMTPFFLVVSYFSLKERQV